MREVAPNKRMLCVSFRLPAAVATAAAGSDAAQTEAEAAQNGAADTAVEQPPAKRPRTFVRGQETGTSPFAPGF